MSQNNTSKALVWDDIGEKFYETGLSKGVLYPMGGDGVYEHGVAWNGLISVTENAEGGEAKKIYADNIKYAVLRSLEEARGTIEAYTYPDEFMPCDGTYEVAPGVIVGQQGRKAFGLSYVSGIGNDVSDDINAFYKLHLVYGCTCRPSEKKYQTVNDSPEPITFSWEYDSIPVNVPGHKATSTLTIDSRYADADALAELKEMLYGNATNYPTLPTPEEVIALFGADNIGG